MHPNYTDVLPEHPTWF